MSEIYKISRALEDLRNYYGLQDIKNVVLNMETDTPVITFLSTLKGHPKEVKYVLTLKIHVDGLDMEDLDGLMKDYLDESDEGPRTEEGEGFYD